MILSTVRSRADLCSEQKLLTERSPWHRCRKDGDQRPNAEGMERFGRITAGFNRSKYIVAQIFAANS
jgi:hypothetical protein